MTEDMHQKPRVIRIDDRDTLKESPIMESVVNKLAKMLIAGINEYNISELFKSGKVHPEACFFTREQVAYAVEHAKEVVCQILERDEKYQKSLILAQFEDNYALARGERDYKACADILTRKSKFLGLDGGEKQEISAKGAIEIIHTYNTLGNRTDATIDLSQFTENNEHPYPDG